MSKRSHEALILQRFTLWLDMLPETQGEVAGQLDAYTCQALAMTNKTHYQRWHNPRLCGDFLADIRLAPQTPLSYIERDWQNHIDHVGRELGYLGESARLTNGHTIHTCHIIACLYMCNHQQLAHAKIQHLYDQIWSVNNDCFLCLQKTLVLCAVRCCEQMEMLETFMSMVDIELYTFWDWRQLLEIAVSRFNNVEPVPAIIDHIKNCAQRVRPVYCWEGFVVAVAIRHRRIALLDALLTSNVAYASFKELSLQMVNAITDDISHYLRMESPYLFNTIHYMCNMRPEWKASPLYTWAMDYIQITLEMRLAAQATHPNAPRLMQCWNQHFPENAIIVPIFPAAHPRTVANQ